MKVTSIFLLVAAIQIYSSGAVNLYVEHQLVEIHFKNEKDRADFRKMVAKYVIDVWNESKKFAMAAMASEITKELQKRFKVKVLKTDILKDAELNLKKNHAKMLSMKRKRLIGNIITQYFAEHFEVNAWFRKLYHQYPFVTLVNIGNTYEGRKTLVIKISISKAKKKSAFIMSGIHAREWLGVASNINFIAKLVDGVLRRNKRIMKILEKFDFYVLPIANPDGYAFTFRDSQSRLWRKTMRPTPQSRCIGVDPNRNFDVKFGVVGVSSDPCSAIFNGKTPFSENCTDNIRNFVKDLKQFELFYDIHSYSQMFFVPQAWSDTELPKENEEIRRVGKLSVEALKKVNNRDFQFGSPAEIIYPAAGSTIDFMYKVMGVKYSFGIETFPDYRTLTPGTSGFLVSPDDIKPSANELSEAILVSAESIPT